MTKDIGNSHEKNPEEIGRLIVVLLQRVFLYSYIWRKQIIFWWDEDDICLY